MVDLDKDDPWAWTREVKQATPLGANISSSQEQAPPSMQAQGDPVTQQIQGLLINKGINEGIDATTKGGKAAYDAYKLGNALNAAAPLAVTPEAAVGTYNLGAGALTGAGSQAAMLAAQDAALTGAGATVGSLAAPLAAAGTEAALATGATAAAAPAAAGLSAAAGAGGTAALTAMGPVGWAIAAGLLAKKLKLF